MRATVAKFNQFNSCVFADWIVRLNPDRYPCMFYYRRTSPRDEWTSCRWVTVEPPWESGQADDAVEVPSVGTARKETAASRKRKSSRRREYGDDTDEQRSTRRKV